MKKIIRGLTVLLSLCVFHDVFCAGYKNEVAVPFSTQRTGGHFSANPIRYGGSQSGVSHGVYVPMTPKYNYTPISERKTFTGGGNFIPVISAGSGVNSGRNGAFSGRRMIGSTSNAQYSNLSFSSVRLKQHTQKREQTSVKEPFATDISIRMNSNVNPIYDQWLELFKNKIGREPNNLQELEAFIRWMSGDGVFDPTPVGDIPWLILLFLLVGYVVSGYYAGTRRGVTTAKASDQLAD